MKLEHDLTPYTKINSKWIKDINYRMFLDLSLRVMKIKTEINKWGLIKLKSFCKAKKTIKGQSIEYKNYLQTMLPRD